MMDKRVSSADRRAPALQISSGGSGGAYNLRGMVGGGANPIGTLRSITHR